MVILLAISIQLLFVNPAVMPISKMAQYATPFLAHCLLLISTAAFLVGVFLAFEGPGTSTGTTLADTTAETFELKVGDESDRHSIALVTCCYVCAISFSFAVIDFTRAVSVHSSLLIAAILFRTMFSRFRPAVMVLSIAVFMLAFVEICLHLVKAVDSTLECSDPTTIITFVS